MSTGRRRLPIFVMMSSAITLVVFALSACGDSLALSHSETPCIYPGQTASIKIHTNAGAQLSFDVQDDFGGSLAPKIPPMTTDSSGDATITWQSPSSLTTTTLHLLLTARKGSLRATRDIHVIVGGNGRSC